MATNVEKKSLRIQEEDGTPTGFPRTLKVTNATLTDNGDGTFSLTTGGGGSSEWTDTGTLLHPADLSGAEDVVVGGTDDTAPIVLKGVSGASGTAKFEAPAGNANSPYLFMIAENVTNLCTNPRFEVDTTSWSADGTGASIARDTGEQWTGAASLKVTTGTTADVGTKFTISSPSLNTAHTAVVRIKGDVGSESISVRLTGDSSGTDSLSHVASASDWYEVPVTHTTDGSDTTLDLEVWETSTSAKDFYIDGILICEKAYPVPYCDGAMAGHDWSGTDDASTSSRPDGMFLLASPGAVGNNFVIRNDGSLFDTSPVINLAKSSGLLADQEYVLDIKGKVSTLQSSGLESALVHIDNSEGNGTALYCESGVTGGAFGEMAYIFAAPNITNGKILAIFGPDDVTTMESSGGKFLSFSDKSNNDHLSMSVNRLQLGVKALNNRKDILIYGSGRWGALQEPTSGTVGVTNGSTALTGSGTVFTTDLAAGKLIRYKNGGSWEINEISSVTDNTNAVLVNNVVRSTTVGSPLDWDFADEIQSGYGYAAALYAENSGGEVAGGDHTFGSKSNFASALWPGSDGVWRAMRSAAVNTLPSITQDSDGSMLVYTDASVSDNAVFRGDGGANKGQTSHASVSDEGHLTLSNDASAPAELRLAEDADNGSSYTGFKAPASLSGNIVYELPASSGTAGQQLTWNSGDVLTWAAAGSGGGSSPTIKMKVADETVNNSSSYQDDDHMTGFSVSANTDYIFTGRFYMTAGNDTPDSKFKLNSGDGVTVDHVVISCQEGNDSSTGGAFNNAQYAEGTALTTEITPDIDNAGNTVLVFSATVEVSGTGGTLDLQWAQNTAHASNTVLLRGSWLKMEEVA